MKKYIFNIIALIFLVSTGCSRTIIQEPTPGFSRNTFHYEAMKLHEIQDKPIKVKK